jgi:hypothetical protein
MLRYHTETLRYHTETLWYHTETLRYHTETLRYHTETLRYHTWNVTISYWNVTISNRIVTISYSLLRPLPLFYNLLNVASNCFHMCSGTCTSRTKCSIEKHKSCLFHMFDLRFFKKSFILQQCLDPNPNFFFVFGFGSSKNFRILSDSDPQHCLEVLLNFCYGIEPKISLCVLSKINKWEVPVIDND